MRADNYPEAGKRPLSSTAPTIIENSDGSLHLVVGGAGGSRIFGSVFQVILNVDWGIDIGQAIGYARLHDQLYPPVCVIEEAFPLDLRDELTARGHNITG
jgi:gamma-glutamyltranspeptidase/glutathione hydrolase/leukotriene-C4 hydrolase